MMNSGVTGRVRLAGRSHIAGSRNLPNAKWVRILAAHARSGVLLDLASGFAEGDLERDVDQAHSWLDGQCIPAEALRAVLTAKDGVTDPRGLRIEHARFVGQLDLRGARFEYPLHFDRCHFDDDLLLDGAKLGSLSIAGSHGQRISLNTARIDGDLAAHNVKARTFEAGSAEIRGQLRLGHATLTAGIGSTAINLDYTSIAGGVFASAGLTCTGEFRAVGSSVGGEFVIDGARLNNGRQDVLILDQSNISGALGAKNVEAVGTVRAYAARVGGQVQLSGSRITNPYVGAVGMQPAAAEATGGRAITFSQASIGDSFFARGLRTEGEFRAYGMTVSGQIDLSNSQLVCAARDDDPDVGAFTARWLTAKRLVLAPARSIGLIDLSRAQIGELETAVDSDPPGPLLATGWKVHEIRGPMRKDWKAAANWLATAPDPIVQPWHALADVYDWNGELRSAKLLRTKAVNRVTSEKSWITKPTRWVYRILVGHGYFPLRIIVWLIALVALGWGVVWCGRGEIVPAKPLSQLAQAAAQAGGATTPSGAGASPERPTLPSSAINAAMPCNQDIYPCFDSVSYTMNNLLPTAVPGTSDWTISPTAGRWVAISLTALKLLSWVFAAMLLAGFTGLLRKTAI